MRVGLLILAGLIITGGVFSYVLYGELHSETVAIEAARQPVVGPDGGTCEAIDFRLESRQLGQLYVRAAEGQSISGRFAVQGPSENDVIFRVYSPHKRLVVQDVKRHQLDFSIPAIIWGDYLFQFDNRFAILTGKTIAFTYCLR